MKNHVLAVLFVIGAMISFNRSHAQLVLIHYWDFNTFTATVTLPAVAILDADYSVLDTSKARMTYKPIPNTSSAYNTYCDETTGDTTNARAGIAAGNCFRARNPNDSMELLFFIPSTHYANLVLKFAIESSSTTADSVAVFSYSLDSGTNWVVSGTGLSEWVDSATTAFTLKTININDPAADSNSRLVFRIRTAGRNTVSGGNYRYDNVTLEGNGPASHVGVAQVGQPAFSFYPNPATNSVNISTGLQGDKSVMIYNTVGQRVYSGTEADLNFSVNVSDLNPGNYFLYIRENNTGKVGVLPLLKQ